MSDCSTYRVHEKDVLNIGEHNSPRLLIQDRVDVGVKMLDNMASRSTHSCESLSRTHLNDQLKVSHIGGFCGDQLENRLQKYEQRLLARTRAYQFTSCRRRSAGGISSNADLSTKLAQDYTQT